MQDFLLRLRNWILKVAYPITTLIGDLHLPYTRKKITSVDYRIVTETIKPGMGIISRTNGELANLFIPGYWGHIGVYVGGRKIIEAVGSHGVREVDLIDFLFKKDEILLIEAAFADEEERLCAAEWVKEQVGKPYDHYFNRTNDAFYCSELYFQAYLKTMMNVPWKPPVTWGMVTVTPQDLADAPDVFRHVLRRPVI